MVEMYDVLKTLSQNLNRIEDLPTDESPTKSILYK